MGFSSTFVTSASSLSLWAWLFVFFAVVCFFGLAADESLGVLLFSFSLVLGVFLGCRIS